MPGESLSFSITADDRASSKFRDVGRAALDSSAKIDVAAASLKLWDDTANKQAKAATTSLNAMKAHSKATSLLADAENVLAGKATTTTKLLADQGRALDDTAKKAKGAGAAVSGLAGTGAGAGGGAAGGGMAALIGAGVALAPVILTVGTGLTGLAAAAYGIYKPISNAAQATGGLQKNLSKLNPEQQQVARGILALGKTFAGFQHTLQPAVLGLFNQGLHLAATLLHDIEPVSAATGKALGGLLGQINATFQGGTWQQFFVFMQRTAAPDIQLLGKNFTDLLNTLPPLVQQLQPVATSLLTITDATIKLIGHLDAYNQHIDQTSQHENALAHVTDLLRTVLFAPGAGLLAALKLLHITGGDAAKGIAATGSAAQGLVKPLQTSAIALGQWKTVNEIVVTQTGRLGRETDVTVSKEKVFVGTTQSVIAGLKEQAKQLNIVAAGYENALGPLEKYIGAQITERADLVQLNQDLKKSHDAIGLKTAAERASFTDTQTFINQTIQTGNAALAAHKGIQGQIDVIEAAIPRLEAVKGKTAAYRQELQNLKGILDKLRAERQINEAVRVTGTGSWSFQQSGVGHATGPGGATGAAAGMLVTGGSPGRDSVPIMAMPGEAVVPTRLTPAVAPFLKAHGVPGFASGGIVGSYQGPVAGLPPWTSQNQSATLTAIGAAIGRAMAAAFTSGAGSTGGHPLSGAGRYSQPALESLWIGAGGPPGLAHLMAAIADAESGGFPNAYNASGASGLWQILGQIVPGNIFNPVVNAENAVAKWRTQGLGAWVTYTSGAYKQYFDQGGWLKPGWNPPMYNGTGRAEHLVPADQRGGHTVVINVTVGHGTHPVAAAQELAKLLNVGARNGVRLRTSILGPG